MSKLLKNFNSVDDDGDDSTMIIDPSAVYGDEERTNQIQSLISVVRGTSSRSPEYLRNELIGKLEQILVKHCQELEQNPTNHNNSYRALIADLIDLIRKNQNSNQRKNENLDKLFENLILLRQKSERISDRIRNEDEIFDSTTIDNKRIKSNDFVVNREECKDLQREIDRLYQIILRQKQKIEELVALMPDYLKRIEPSRTFDEQPVITSSPLPAAESTVSASVLSKLDAQKSPSADSFFICPICQAIFRQDSMNLQQLNVHIDEHLIDSHSF